MRYSVDTCCVSGFVADKRGRKEKLTFILQGPPDCERDKCHSYKLKVAAPLDTE